MERKGKKERKGKERNVVYLGETMFDKDNYELLLKTSRS